MATPVHETLQISQFTTAGELKSQFSFVDAPTSNAETTVDVKWKAPKAADVPAAGLPVTFTFVVRDDRAASTGPPGRPASQKYPSSLGASGPVFGSF